METIYPEETLVLLAKFDELMNKIREEYQQTYPDPSSFLREVLGEQEYARIWHEALHKRRCGILEDPIYQECIRQKAKIISLSPCTYRFNADEIRQSTAKET